MKIRDTIYLFLAALLLSACASEDTLWTESDLRDTPQSGDMAVRLGYALFESEKTQGTRASIVGGDENPSNYIHDMWLLCFTHEGIYLGSRKVTLIGAEQHLDDVEVDAQGNVISRHDNNCWGRYLFEGSVPARTSRIHFVANVPEESIPGVDQIGGQENSIVKSRKMRVTYLDREISYWGFHGEESPEMMRSWLALTTWRDSLDAHGNPVRDEQGNVIQVVDQYHKKEGSIVHMVRDRARLKFGDMFDYRRTTTETVTDHSGNTVELEPNDITYDIEEIDWIVSNGLGQGYIAPFHNRAGEDPFDNYYDPNATPRLKEDRLTPYDQRDRDRIVAVSSDEMVPAWRKNWTAAEMAANSVPIYLFEDENIAQDPPKVILRVKYNDRIRGVKVKYHTLMLLKNNNEACKIYRNHQYTLNIYGLPWEGLGYIDFADAVASVEYANNRTVTIDERVEDVNDGQYELTIIGGTYRIYQDPSLVNTTQTVQFRYTTTDDHNHGVAGLTAADFTAAWSNVPFASFARPEVTVNSYNASTGIGTITFTLGTTINSALGMGSIRLQAMESGLSRFINIYSIDNFNFRLDGDNGGYITPTLSRVSGVSRTIRGKNCPTYQLQVKLPGEYPANLFPVTFYIASTTLSPYALYDNGTEVAGATFGVATLSTENGSLMNGEVLGGMTYSNNANAWNYRDVNRPWNYWYTYTLNSKPTAVINGDTEYDTQDRIYTIYFDDVRPLRATANQATDIGLFLKIKYFGDAVAITE